MSAFGEQVVFVSGIASPARAIHLSLIIYCLSLEFVASDDSGYPHQWHLISD